MNEGSKSKQTEESVFIESLQTHGLVAVADSVDVPLAPGQTHVLVGKAGEPPLLVEKRKNCF